jgi:hypothetical protein
MILRVRIPPEAPRFIMHSRATSNPIEWTGDLNDDCTSIWADLMLRAEEMDKQSWWWAVSDQLSGGLEIGSSNRSDDVCRSGAEARGLAEDCARAYLGLGAARNSTSEQDAVVDNRLSATSRNDPLDYNL